MLSAHESWEPTVYSSINAHAPTPLPDRVVLTWEEDPATTQSVSWRTDTNIKEAWRNWLLQVLTAEQWNQILFVQNNFFEK